MKLEIFQSDMGDCLLLEGADKRLMLIDGGMSSSYKLHVAPRLGELRDKKKVLDVVYISHIDRDHISGVLQMLNDEVKWIEHQHQLEGPNPNPKKKPPERPRPPKVKNIWHNAFHELVGDNEGEFEEMLAASAAVLSGVDPALHSSSEVERVRALASEYAELATSVEEAIRVSRRIGRDQLNIKLNAPARGKLMMARGTKSKPFKLGGMTIHIIGPTQEEFVGLKKEWNKWLDDNRAKLVKIKKQAAEDADRLKAGDASDIISPKLHQAEGLIAGLPLSEPEPGELGKPKSVTAPNVASLMLFVEEKGKTLLLTGDGRHADIIKGLERIGKLKKGGGLHVNVLKVQHHGSKNNMNESFCQKVTADHYLFCGFNGGNHSNPHVDVIKAVAASRLSKDAAVRSPNPKAGRPFTFHFNGSVAVTKGNDKEHMKKVEKLVKSLATKSGGQMKYFFNEDSFFPLNI